MSSMRKRRGDRRNGGGPQASYFPLAVDRDRSDTRVRLGAVTDMQVLVEDSKGQAIDAGLYQLQARVKNLSGEGPPETLRLKQGHVSLLPGRWELALAPISTYYTSRFFRSEGGRGGAWPRGWMERNPRGGESDYGQVRTVIHAWNAAWNRQFG